MFIIPQFSDQEKEKIRTELISSARQYFVTNGLKKTSLEELTSSVGIAKSSFYSFFDSKEALYLELLELEAPGIEERVWEKVNCEEDTVEGIKKYLYSMSQELETNPLIQRLHTHPEELQMVSRKVTPEFVAKKMQRSVLPLMNYISKNQKLGHIVDEEPAVIAGVLRSAMLIQMHRDDIGEAIYSKVEKMVFNAIANELTNDDKAHS